MKFLATLCLLIAVVAKPSSMKRSAITALFRMNQDPCPSVCPKHLNLDGFFCDQEGKDYGNDCFFKVAACKAKKNGKILIRTACPPVKELPAICMMPKKVGPCEAGKPRYFYNTRSTKCEKFLYGGCQGNGNNFMNIRECNQKCRSRQMNQEPCPSMCPRHLKVGGVCDQEGYNWGNDCGFKAAACEAKKNGEILILTACPDVKNQDLCLTSECPDDLYSVCDQEGKEYDNECYFKNAACEAKKNGEILILAPCPHVKNQEPCRQPCHLLQYLDGVCDQEGKDYGNNCYFEVAACKAKRNGKILIRTPCPPVKEDPWLPCRRPCPAIYIPVCDSEGKEYPHECFFETAKCIAEKKGENLILAECPEKINGQFLLERGRKMRSKDEVRCIRACHRLYDPVCDSVGKSYANKCIFEIAQCRAENKGENLILADCPEEINEQFPSERGRKMRLKDEDQCPRYCSRLLRPVCDSTGKSYDNYCLFEMSKCFAEKRGETLILADCLERGRKMDKKMIRNQ